jgi:hypothetical protein
VADRQLKTVGRLEAMVGLMSVSAVRLLQCRAYDQTKGHECRSSVIADSRPAIATPAPLDRESNGASASGAPFNATGRFKKPHAAYPRAILQIA